MVKTVKMQNALSRTYNGIKQGKMVNVDEASVPFYESNGFIKVTEAIAEAQAVATANAEAEAIAEAEAKAEEQAVEEQAEEQAELDAEYQEKAQAVATGSSDAENAGHDASTDVEALNKELENAPAPKKTKPKAK